MKYLGELTKLKIFNYSDVCKILGNKSSALSLIQDYLDKGYIRRIKHNLYTVISLESGECVADKFLIASNITDSSFISHHSAFEFYNYYNQVYNCVNVSSFTKFKDFEFDDNRYSFIKATQDLFIENIRGIKVTSIERTIVDSIKDSNKYSDLEETLNCINMIPYISSDDILKYLEIIDSKMLYKKVGIILSMYKNKFNIHESFFEKCHFESDSVRGHFDNNLKNHVYNAEWKIYIDKDIYSYINKE